jgi:hypothetical protein
LNVCITNVDAGSYLSSILEKLIYCQGMGKKKKYLQACVDQQRHFTPFVSSTDGLLGKEATVLVK